VALWIALFANNVGVLPTKVGFDVDGHMDYITYIQEHKSLPLAGQGWETFQAPLYYVICAGLLQLFSTSVTQSSGIMLLRVFGMGIGIVHFVLVWIGLRWLFPGRRATQFSGLVLAGCLPPLLYISQYISNEGMGAMLVSATVVATLRILKAETGSYFWYVLLGLCLGLGLLTKVTAVLVVPPVLGALVWKELSRSGWAPLLIGKLCLVLAFCVLVCGWHYARVWAHSGARVVGGWEPTGGAGWWQDEGYQTRSYYFRFGESLRQPWFAGSKSFADGIYSTLWGDGLIGGNNDSRSRAPWNYDLMAAGYWLAVVPTVVVLLGGLLAVVAFIRYPSAEWFLLLSLGFCVLAALVQVSLTAPYHCVVKAFYGMSALLPVCAIGANGFESACRAAGRLKPGLQAAGVRGYEGRVSMISAAIAVVCCVWAMNAYAAFWIVRSSAAVAVTRSRDLVKTEHPHEALLVLQTALKGHPQDPDITFSAIPLLLTEGKSEEASRLADSLLTANRDAAESQLAMVMVTIARQRVDEAIDWTRRAIGLAPGWVLPRQNLVGLLFEQKRYDEGVQAAREGLGIAPFSAELHWRLGEALLVAHDDEAGEQFRLASGLEQDRAMGQCKWGEFLAEHGQPAEAIVHYHEALWLNRALPDALNNLAWLRATNPRAGLRDGAEAVRLAEDACRVTKYEMPVVVGTLAAAYAEAGRFEDAVATAQKARALAINQRQGGLAEKNLELIGLFKAGKPYREKE
jgi:tetratricopeptide (TPR) repeat protein